MTNDQTLPKDNRSTAEIYAELVRLRSELKNALAQGRAHDAVEEQVELTHLEPTRTNEILANIAVKLEEMRGKVPARIHPIIDRILEIDTLQTSRELVTAREDTKRWEGHIKKLSSDLLTSYEGIMAELAKVETELERLTKEGKMPFQ